MWIMKMYKNNKLLTALGLLIIGSELLILMRDGLIGGLSLTGTILASTMGLASLFGYSSNFDHDITQKKKVIINLFSTIGLGGAVTVFLKWDTFIQNQIDRIDQALLYIPLFTILICSGVFIYKIKTLQKN